MKRFLINNWVTIVLGIISIYLSIVFYFKSKYERKLTFSLRTQRKKTSELKPLLGELPDVTAMTFSLENKGKCPIIKEDILEPLTIKLPDAGSEFIDVKLTFASNKYTKLEIPSNDCSSRNIFSLDFDVLDHRDRGVIQMIIRGNKSRSLYLSGKILGIRTENTNKQLDPTDLLSKLLSMPLIMYGSLFIFFGTIAYECINVNFYGAPYEDILTVVLKAFKPTICYLLSMVLTGPGFFAPVREHATG